MSFSEELTTSSTHRDRLHARMGRTGIETLAASGAPWAAICALALVGALQGCAAPTATTFEETPMHQEPELRTTGAQRVAGFTSRASFDDASSIGELWQAFYSRADELDVDGPTWSVYHDYDSDYRGAYSVLVGLAVDPQTDTPADWSTVEVPEQTYLVFPVRQGPMPDVVIDTWRTIWEHFDENCPFERAYSFDYERHGDTTEILVSVRRRE